MIKETALATPSKELFLEMFTRDLSLEDCILDLIDNSIDSFIRARNIDLSKIMSLPNQLGPGSLEINLNGVITIDYDETHFNITDNCGGIKIEDAKNEVFRFGHSSSSEHKGHLGVYGVGLKRAIFKIGNHIVIESKTPQEGFIMEIPVSEWAKEETWTLPFEVTEGTHENGNGGTSIKIDSFRDEVAERLKSGTFETQLFDMISRTYCLFLDTYIHVILNGHMVNPVPIPLGTSENANIAKEEFSENDVQVTIFAGLAARTEDGNWRSNDAGWYVACNGRLVVAADKTFLTGWGAGLPSFVPKFRGFIGIVLFFSENPLNLPWTTTKRGLNRESMIFLKTRGRMIIAAQSVINFLNDMYSSEEVDRIPQRQVADGIKAVDIRQLNSSPEAQFKAIIPRQIDPSVRVQFDAKEIELRRVRTALNQYNWSAAKIGRFTFDHYLKTECPE